MVDAIAAGSTALAQAQLMSQAQTSVLASALDTMSQQGQAVVKLIDSASPQQTLTDPALGTLVDTYA